MNPDLVICGLEKNVSLNFELTIEKGRGYVPAEENKKLGAPIGTIFHGFNIYCQLRMLNIQLKTFRVEQKTDYEKTSF